MHYTDIDGTCQYWLFIEGISRVICVQDSFQKRPSEEGVEGECAVEERKAREDQYDLSSADIGVVHTGTKSNDTSRQTLPSTTELPETTVL